MILNKISSLNNLLLIAVFLISSLAFGQDTLSGRVMNEYTNEGVGYASVIVKNKESGAIIKGTETDVNGYFSLETERNVFSLEVRSIGFKSLFIDTVDMKGSNQNLGTLKLELIDQALQEVEVVYEKSTTEFRLDKRIFNVGKDISSSGAGALEVLNHVPSVTVSIEGIVSLRGSSGVQILIDGKPSVMSDDPAKALSGITADMILRVEVITNPSAKYESEGTSGIINIVLKKEQKRGVNGSVSINGGWPHNHSIGFSLNARSEKFNVFTQIGTGYRSLPRYNESVNRDLIDSMEIASDGVYYRNEIFANMTLGTDYYINKYNTITLSGNVAYEWEQQPSLTNFYQTTLDGDTLAVWEREETTRAGNPKYQYDLQYKKEFKDTSAHTLVLSTQGRFFGKEQSSDFENRSVLGTDVFTPQRTQTTFQQADYIGKVDYFNPFKKNYTFETGAQYTLNDVGNNYSVQNEDALGDWVVDSAFTNNFIFRQSVFGVYASGSYEKKKWGAKIGLRVENTDLRTELVTTNVSNRQNYTNFFPTVHTAYKISKKVSMQLGYSRRVSRPRLWNLNPFFNISNNFNIRRGNPDLLPEFTDSYEWMSIYNFDKFSMNIGLYYRHTTQTIERVSIFEDNVNTVMPMNIGTSDVVGFEWNAKWDAAKWLDFNSDFNFNYFNRKGDFDGQNFDFSGNRYTGKLMMKIKASKMLDIEFTGNYESRYKTIQGEELNQVYLDAGLRLKIWKRKGAINFGVRDVFASRIKRTVVDQAEYYLYQQSTRGRTLTLGFSYAFGKGDAVSYSNGGHH
ncbi:MAG: hypothetical protein ACJA1C_000805 [Crocinitomicaceae bacterium]|jgi:hypothetical protein